MRARATVATLALVNGILGIITGPPLIAYAWFVDALGSGSTPNKGALVSTSYALGLLALTFGILSIAFSRGLDQLKPWAWSLGLALYTGTLLLFVPLGLAGTLPIEWPSLIVILCSATIVIYLLMPGVRRDFKVMATNEQMQLTTDNREDEGATKKDSKSRVRRIRRWG